MSIWEANSTHSNALKSIKLLQLRVISNEEKAYYQLPSEFLEVQALLAAAMNTGGLQHEKGMKAFKSYQEAGCQRPKMKQN